MEVKKFKKMLKDYKNNLDMIVRLYCMNKIYLTSYQLNKVLKLRGEKKYPHYEIEHRRQKIVWS